MATILAVAAGFLAGWLLCKIESDFASLERARERRVKFLAMKARIDEALLPGPWQSWEGR